MAAGVRLRGARALSWRLFLRRHSDLGLTRQPLGGDNERKMTSCIGSSFIKHWERQLSTEKRSAQEATPHHYIQLWHFWVKNNLCYYRVNPIALDEKTYDKIADETLQELLAYFEDLVDSGECSDESDVQYEVRTVQYALCIILILFLYYNRVVFWLFIWEVSCILD